jgi:predicted nucleic acid-binding protein
VRGDRWHEASSALFRVHSGPFIVPTLVLAETAFMIARAMGAPAEGRFLAQLADSELQLEPITHGDLLRMAELVSTYADLPLGVVDASVISVAERLNATEVATLDHRHFRVVRPRHTAAFTLLP